MRRTASLKFDPRESIAAIINTIIQTLVVQHGGDNDQAQLVGSIAEGAVKGIGISPLSAEETMKNGLVTAVRDALLLHDVPEEFSKTFEDTLQDKQFLIRIAQAANPFDSLKKLIYELCTSIEACDPDTFPTEAVASDFLENMDSLLWSEPDFRGMYQLYLTQKMQSDVKWTVNKIGEMSRQWESSIVNNSAVQSEYPSFITPRMIDQCSKYIKRPTLVQDLMNRLLEKQSILVWSIGGVGKTELVKELISTIQSVPCEETGISEIAWIKYNPSGLLDSIHDAFSDEMDWIQFQKMCERKRERLLVVIDDVEKVDDPYLCQLSLPCRLIVTSRVRELPALVHWPLPELTVDEQKQLFFGHCPVDNPQERWLDEILALTSNHTVTIEFLAKIAYYNDWSLLELYQKLVMLGFRLSEERVSSVHEKLQKEETVITQFCKLFQLLSYTEEERKLLVYSSVLPNMPYTVDQAKRWFDCMQLSLLNKLYQVGMLESSRKNGRLVYWMHSVIAAAVRFQSIDMLYSQTKPLIRNFVDEMDTGESWGTEYKKFYLIPFCWAVYDIMEQHLNSEDDIDFLMRLCYISMESGNAGLAQRLAQRALTVDYENERWEAVFRDHKAYGDAETRLWHTEEARQQYLSAIHVLDTKLGGKSKENHSNYSAVYHSIANTYQQDSKLPEALEYAQMALTEENAKENPIPYELSSALSSLATIYLDMGETETALQYIDAAIEENGEIDLENSDHIMLYAYKGSILSALDRYPEAASYFDIVKDFRERHFSNMHPDTADLYLEYSECMNLTGCSEEAIRYISLALEIYEYNFGKKDIRYIKGLNMKGLLHDENGDLEQACQAYDEMAELIPQCAIGYLDLAVFYGNYASTLMKCDLDSALEVNKQAWSAYKQCESNLELKAIIVENFAEIYAGFQDLRAIEYYETLKKMVVGYIDRVHFTLSEAQLYILTDKTEQADALLRSLITDLEEGMEYPHELACCYGYMSQITEGDEKEGFKVKILNLLEYMDDEEAALIEQQFFD